MYITFVPGFDLDPARLSHTGCKDCMFITSNNKVGLNFLMCSDIGGVVVSDILTLSDSDVLGFFLTSSYKTVTLLLLRPCPSVPFTGALENASYRPAIFLLL